MMTSSMESGDIAERLTTSFMTIAPSWGAVKLARLLRNLPVGVRTAPTMTGACSDIGEFSFGARYNGPSIHIIVDMRKRQNVSFSLYRLHRGGVNQGFAGSVPIWNPAGMLISHMEEGISEVGISLRLSYIGSPLLEPAALCSTLTGI